MTLGIRAATEEIVRVELEEQQGKAPDRPRAGKGLTRDRATKAAKAGNGASWIPENSVFAPCTNPITRAATKASTENRGRDSGEGCGLRNSERSDDETREKLPGGLSKSV